VELFEQIRREYEHGGGTIRGVAKKLGIHRRMVREAVLRAVPVERKTPVRERCVGSCRRDLLAHIVALNERHLRRLRSEYVRYHHEDRTHLGLEKGTPDGRIRSLASGRVLAQERLGGLHHRYDRAA
jgi:putative transposase